MSQKIAQKIELSQSQNYKICFDGGVGSFLFLRRFLQLHYNDIVFKARNTEFCIYGHYG